MVLVGIPINWYNHFKKLSMSTKAKYMYNILYDLAISFLGIYSTDVHMYAKAHI